MFWSIACSDVVDLCKLVLSIQFCHDWGFVGAASIDLACERFVYLHLVVFALEFEDRFTVLGPCLGADLSSAGIAACRAIDVFQPT